VVESADLSVMIKMRDHAVAVTCHLEPTQNPYHLSKLLAGLCELAKQGRIELRFTTVADTSLQSSTEALLNVFVTHDGTTTQVVFDVEDRSDRFEMALLDAGAVYFKRSFYPPDICSLPASWQHRILPFGLNYGCRGSLDESQLLESSVAPPSLANYRNFLSFHDFERPPHSPVKPAIVFQTRAWAPDSTSDDADEVNESRAEVIRALRRSFPGRFYGGFVGNAHARRYYPDLLTERSQEQNDYIQFSQRCLIGISTRGLHHSVPFKLPEIMASSRAIVSHSLRAELPAPCLPGTHFLEFRSPEECVEQCDRILSDLSLARSLRRASWEYYQSQVRPGRHVGNLLDRAIRSQSGAIEKRK
jgi:hypothetical protein